MPHVEEEIDIRNYPKPAPVVDESEGKPGDEEEIEVVTDQTETTEPGGPLGDDDTPVAPEEDDAPAPQNALVEALRAELAEERRARHEMMERIAPKAAPDEETETDYDAIISEHFEEGSEAAKAFGKIARSLKADSDRKLQREVARIQQSTGRTEAHMRQQSIVSNLRKDGYDDAALAKIEENAFRYAEQQKRSTGKLPDIQEAYTHGENKFLKSSKVRAADSEEARRTQLAQRKNLATKPPSTTPVRTGGKVSDKDIAEAARAGKSVRDIWAMEDEAQAV